MRGTGRGGVTIPIEYQTRQAAAAFLAAVNEKRCLWGGGGDEAMFSFVERADTNISQGFIVV